MKIYFMKAYMGMSNLIFMRGDSGISHEKREERMKPRRIVKDGKTKDKWPDRWINRLPEPIKSGLRKYRKRASRFKHILDLSEKDNLTDAISKTVRLSPLRLQDPFDLQYLADIKTARPSRLRKSRVMPTDEVMAKLYL